MNLFLRILSKVITVTCAISFVATAVAALVLFNLERKLFNAQTYKLAFANQQFYERMPAILAQTLAASASDTNLDPCSNNRIACGAEERSPEARACFENVLGLETYQILAANQRIPTEAELSLAGPCLETYGVDQPSSEGGPPEFMQNLSAQDWEVIITALFPPEEIKSFTNRTFDVLFAYLNGKADSASVSMLPVKKRLSGEAGVQMVLQMMRAQPACTAEQLSLMVLGPAEGADFPICYPPDELIPMITPLIQAQLQSAAAGIPDEAVLIPASTEKEGLGGLLTLRLSMRLSPLIPLVFLLGVTIFTVRSLKDWLRWWGIPFLITGLAGAVVGISATPVIGSLIRKGMVEKMPAVMPAILVETGSDLVMAVLRQYLKPVVWQGILLAVIGLTMTLAVVFLRRFQEGQLEAHEAVTIT